MGSIITLPEDFTSSIILRIHEIFRDFSPLLFLILGIIIGFYFLRAIIRVFTIRGDGGELDDEEFENEEFDDEEIDGEEYV